jgi:hypothetical protein
VAGSAYFTSLDIDVTVHRLDAIEARTRIYYSDSRLRVVSSQVST